MSGQKLAGLIVPRADEHLGEYVPPSAERLAWLSGFTGSAGLAAILRDKAAVFTDGRYMLQVAQQTDPSLWERRHVIDDPPQAWIAAEAGKGARIGFDPWQISQEGLARYTDAGLDMVPLPRNPVDAIWQDRPAPPMSAAVPHPIAFAGQTSAEKRAAIGASLQDAGQHAAILSDPASIAWLLNIRGSDIPFTPVTLAFAILHADGRAALFVDARKIPDETRAWLGDEVSIAEPGALTPAIASLAGKVMRLDPAGSPIWFSRTARTAGATLATAPDPCLLAKACKNEVEQEGARAAHRRDGVAVCRFLHWLAEHAPSGGLTEMSVADRLLEFRRELEHFRGESFPAISGAGEHGAIIHYRVTETSNRPLRANEAYLVDSGGQFLDGTTDVTRTIWTGPDAPPDELRARFTAVLKGHIALATLVFPQGISGVSIDAFARRALWQSGLDYDHGTGHGVGSYLSVHEGPAGISRAARPVALAPGMILSNEPGLYIADQYGIRLENLVMVQPKSFGEGSKPFLCFETLTLAPFDRALIDPGLLSAEEVRWLDAYHATVLDRLGPALDETVRAWLVAACRPIEEH
jgi:Xaa-Pro aminopeptidase